MRRRLPIETRRRFRFGTCRKAGSAGFLHRSESEGGSPRRVSGHGGRSSSERSPLVAVDTQSLEGGRGTYPPASASLSFYLELSPQAPGERRVASLEGKSMLRRHAVFGGIVL